MTEAENQEEIIRKYSNEEDKIDKHAHSLIGQLSVTLINTNDRDMQRILRDTDNSDCALVMKGMKGQARKRIFDNVSKRLGVMIAEYMDYMGPVRMCDVEESASTILKNYVRLADAAEIDGNQVSEAKLVLDIYETAERNNRELKAKYKDIKQMLDSIYAL